MSESLPPRIFLFLENPRKGNNLGSIIRCANAFGINTIVAVGFDKCSVEGSHGASKNVQIVAFPTSEQAASFLRKERQCVSIIGLLGSCHDGYDPHGQEITELDGTVFLTSMMADTLRSASASLSQRSVPVVPGRISFSNGNLAVAVSKQKGLSNQLAKHCDSFVHIPHISTEIRPGENAPILLDTPACLSILLHEYTQWAGYHERSFDRYKFEVVRPSKIESSQRTTDKEKSKKNNGDYVESDDILAGIGLTIGDESVAEDRDKGDY